MSLVMVWASCSRTGRHASRIDRNYADSVVSAVSSVAGLQLLADSFAKTGNAYGQMAACRELGKARRNKSDFVGANEAHRKGLDVALAAHDTLQIVQALNNIGTNYRRMGMLDKASVCHYEALSYCNDYSDTTSREAQKNRVVSLNGIGNVHLTLRNNELADSVFRLALEGERRLGSALGQAINCANIGAIFESAGKLDSAHAYYRRSMELNRQIDSRVGMSLCHTHFGRIYEKQHRLDSAVQEYLKAYDLMEKEHDDWHRLESGLALARAYIKLGNAGEARRFIDKSKQTASHINSPEHLAEVYRAESQLYASQGNHLAALSSYKKSHEFADSVTGSKNAKELQNVRIRYERANRQKEFDRMQQRFDVERSVRHVIMGMLIFGIVAFSIIIGFMWYTMRLRARNQRITRQMEQMRANFFVNVTHEFRTPLTIIQSAAQEILRKAPDGCEMHRNASDILCHGQRLLNLINQILDIAKMTSAALTPPKWYRGNVVDMLTMTCERFANYAAERGISLVYLPNEEVVQMDFVPDYMQKILQNLVSNAVKFSSPGTTVTVASQCVGTTLQITVTDHGIGMSEEEMKHIFKPFYKAAEDGSRAGTGIGLSLVKLSVEALGGTIRVDSVPSQSTVFIVHLPIREHPDAEPIDHVRASVFAESGLALAPADEQQMPDDTDTDDTVARILVVEDTPAVARYISRQLGDAYHFSYASDGIEGLAKATELVPDLIITDVMMPKLNGFSFCRKVRRSELLNHIPLIMVTAKATHQARVEGLQAGADAYIEKPFHADELSVRVEKLLEQRHCLRQKFSSAVKQGEEPEPNLMTEADKRFIDKLERQVQAVIAKGKIDYNALAYELCISRVQLNRKVKAITGCTTTEYLFHLRMNLAKRLLDTTDCQVWEVALKCGIDNATYFGVLFKKATGLTPLQYRGRTRTGPASPGSCP